jgi:hypothetical protein
MALLSFNEWRGKDRKDKNHGKQGFVAGNPRFNQTNKQTFSGSPGKRRIDIKTQDKKTNFGQKED